MRTRLTLHPSQRGARQLFAQYGEQLICVRYRYDKQQKERFKTVELIVEESDWEPHTCPRTDESLVLDEHTFEFLKVEHHDRWMGFKREDIRKWFAEAGLSDIAVDCVGENCCAQSGIGDEYAKVSIFVALGVK